jgi:hypothetical protein
MSRGRQQIRGGLSAWGFGEGLASPRLKTSWLNDTQGFGIGTDEKCIRNFDGKT